MQRFSLKRYQVKKLLKNEDLAGFEVQPGKRRKFKSLDRGSRRFIEELLQGSGQVPSSKVIQEKLQ